MELRRFYVRPEDIVDGMVRVTGNEYRHMTGVLRFKVGYQAILCDNTGVDYVALVRAIDKNSALLEIVSQEPNSAELEYDLTLCCGLIKPDKMEIEVQKAVEIGVKRIRPFVSRYTSETEVRQDRLERIAMEACKQCGRAILPEICAPVRFETLFDETSRYYMAYEKETKALLRIVLDKPQKGESVSLVIGSEGGFAEEEAALAREKGATLFSLGKRILRAETAAIVALGNVCALTEEL